MHGHCNFIESVASLIDAAVSLGRRNLREAPARGYQRLRIVRERRFRGKHHPVWVWFDFTRTFRFSTGKRCPINGLNIVASTGWAGKTWSQSS